MVGTDADYQRTRDPEFLCHQPKAFPLPDSVRLLYECFNIRNVLGSAGRALVLDQSCATDYRDCPSLESETSPLCDGLVKSDAVSPV